MKESSGSQLFRTTTGIPSGPNAFDKSRFIMTFLTILGVTEILCSFRLVLEVKTGKEIPESSREMMFVEFLEKCFQQTILLYQMQKTTTPVRVRQLAYVVCRICHIYVCRILSHTYFYWHMLHIHYF